MSSGSPSRKCCTGSRPAMPPAAVPASGSIRTQRATRAISAQCRRTCSGSGVLDIAGHRRTPFDTLRSMVVRRALLAVLVLAAALAGAGCGADDGTGKPGGPARVQLALDFTANAVHAPIFAAVR